MTEAVIACWGVTAGDSWQLLSTEGWPAAAACVTCPESSSLGGRPPCPGHYSCEIMQLQPQWSGHHHNSVTMREHQWASEGLMGVTFDSCSLSLLRTAGPGLSINTRAPEAAVIMARYWQQPHDGSGQCTGDNIGEMTSSSSRDPEW